jgi:hypothetical protein
LRVAAERTPNRAIPILASLLVLLLSAACASVSGGVKAPGSPPGDQSALSGGQKIGKVAVSLDEETLPPEVIAVAVDYEVSRILDNRVRQHLSAGMSAGGALELEVKVIGMRLRSNGTAIFWGFFAGADWITVDVDVKKNGRSVKRFQTGTSTALGGFILGGRSTRIGRMMKTLGERIADGVG